ncbi:MAG: type II toxin-antitoxin system HicB family antitoxin [Patescibacteria group bacterium]
MLKEKFLDFTVFFQPAEEGGYTVFVPTLPGCITEGDTIEEARAMAIDAIECYLGSLIQDGLEIPTEAESLIGKVRINLETA